MNYYENLLQSIQKALQEEDYKRAEELIQDELKAPYVPSNVLSELKLYLSKIPHESVHFSLTDEQIEEYLKSDKEKQLIAVNALNGRNLRDYYDICNEYLKNGDFKDAKVLLIESLIRQEISDEYLYINEDIEYRFIPRFVLLPEESSGFQKASHLLEDYYMKEPSKYELAKSLLYKKCILNLPISYEEEESDLIAKEIIDYIEKAFA